MILFSILTFKLSKVCTQGKSRTNSVLPKEFSFNNLRAVNLDKPPEF